MSPALLLLLALQAPVAPPAADPQLAELRRAWEESCADRAYGTFDDVCTQMSDQIGAYERESRRAARKAPAASLPPTAAAGSPPPPVAAQASALPR